jgi:hypothetical protein
MAKYVKLEYIPKFRYLCNRAKPKNNSAKPLLTAREALSYLSARPE